MSHFRRAWTAAAFAMTACLAPQTAGAAGNPVVVVDMNRVYAESAAGKSAIAQLKAIENGIQAELSPQGQALDKEGKALGLEGKTREQAMEALKADKALQGKAAAYQQKLGGFLNKQNLRANEMQATLEKAQADVIQQARPSIDEVMKARGASLVLERNSTVANAPEVDITNDVIAKYSQRVSKVSVAKVSLTKQ